MSSGDLSTPSVPPGVLRAHRRSLDDARAPRTRFGVTLRNAMYGFLTSKRMLGSFEKLVKGAASDFVLPEYT